MSNKIIVMTRGDTLRFRLNITDACKNQYILTDEDTLYFGIVDPHQLFEDALVKKRYFRSDVTADGSLLITLDSRDTLDLFPGVYYYSLKLHKVNTAEKIDDVITIVNKTKFIIND